MSQNIAILGAGSWGTALASVAARKGHKAILYGRDEKVIKEINQSQINKSYLPNISLPKQLVATTDFEACSSKADIILIVTPAQSITDISKRLKKTNTEAELVLCAKGIDQKTGQLPAEILQEALPNHSISALSGPSFSTDVAMGLPTAVTLAHDHMRKAQELSEILSDPKFRIYASDDLKGVELGGALKNVIALAIGVCRGMQLGASAEAALIARGFAELNRLATSMDAKPQTITGLSGLGDLVLTCSSPQSRNFSYGICLGEGKDISNLPLAEGVFTAKIAKKLAKDNNVDCPIIGTVAQLIDGSIGPKEAVKSLLSRPLKPEQE